jgi:hypothetical protein
MVKGFGKPKPFDVLRVAGGESVLAFSATSHYPSYTQTQALNSNAKEYFSQVENSAGRVHFASAVVD